VDERLKTIQKLTDAEWQAILDLAIEKARNQKTKEEEKAAKGKIKDTFAKVESTINKVIADQDRKKAVLQSLKKFESSFDYFENNILNRFPTDNAVLVNKNAGQEELGEIFEAVADLRKEAYDALVDFHYHILDQTEEKE